MLGGIQHVLGQFGQSRPLGSLGPHCLGPDLDLRKSAKQQRTQTWICVGAYQLVYELGAGLVP